MIPKDDLLALHIRKGTFDARIYFICRLFTGHIIHLPQRWD